MSALGALPLLAGCAAGQDYSDAQLYSGFTLVDPVAQTQTGNAWLVVRDGLIAETGTGAAPDGAFASVHDVSGLYGMPGLIDAHAHITIGPFETGVENGAPFLGLEAGGEYSRFNAAVALAFGVTTVRNPAGATDANQEYDSMIASGEWAGPEALHAGAVIQPPPLGGESFAYPTTPQEWDAEAASQAAAGMTYFKLYHDLTEPELAEGVRAANAHGLIPIAHLNGVSWTRAAELGVRQIEHALPTSADLLEPDVRAGFNSADPTAAYMYRWFELADFDGPLIAQMIGTLVEREVAVDLTMIVNDVTYRANDLERVFPLSERVYYHPVSFASAKGNYDAIAGVWTAQDFVRADAAFARVLEFAKRLYDAGVPLMIGTDGTGGAPIYARELSHHVAAGIPAWDVLRIATAQNAKLMGLGDRIGRIAPGMEADLVFLRADPVADVQIVRDVALVVTNGQAHRPEDLLDIARDIAMAAGAQQPVAAD
jgi:imidazolonepropionase-like amidohydrolase